LVDLNAISIRCRGNAGREEPVDTAACFYQSADGQRVYLDGLNVDMLRQAGLPEMISAKILDVEVFEQTPATRKGRRMFSHAPLSATLAVCEVDLSPVVPEAVMQAFKARVDENRASRESKALKAFLDKQRRQKAADAAKQAEADAVVAMMKSMPRLGLESGDDKNARDNDLKPESNSTSASNTPSWAVLAKDGFAATGPSLSSLGDDAESPISQQAHGSSPPIWGTSPPVWGTVGTVGAAGAVASPAWGSLTNRKPASKPASGGSKRTKNVLFSSSSNRQY